MLVFDSAWAQLADNRAQLIDAIDAAKAMGGSPKSFDVTGVTHLADEFEDEVVGTEIIRFRLRQDRDAEFARWAVERRKVVVGNNGNQDAIAYSSVTVRGNETVTWTGSVVPARETHADFRSAYENSAIPAVTYWALLHFPFFGNPSDEMNQLFSKIMSPKSTVLVRDKDESLTFAVRTVHTENRFDVREWEFSLPDYLPQRIELKRAIDGGPLTYHSQWVSWKQHLKNAAPHLISSETLILRKKKVGEADYQRGIRYSDTEFKWNSVNDPMMKTEVARDLFSVVAIQKFLAE
jgi:hypothetical protein